MNRTSREYGFKRSYLVIFTLVMLLATAFFNGTASAAAPVHGGTLTMGVDLDFRGFDPLKAGFIGIGDRSVIMAVEERLFDMDKKGNLIPELGLSAKVSKDNKTWTITLRQGVSFHDGTPFNADAVVDHWQRLLDPKNRFFGLSFLQAIESVQKINDFSVKFALKHPSATFKSTLSSPVGMIAYIPSPKATREGTQDRAPVGTGPFVFKEWKANDRLIVVRNPNYWQKGKPYLDAVTFRPMPDMQARFASIQSGETDVIRTDRGINILQASADRAFKVYESDAGGAYPFVFNTSKPPLNDIRVRQALAHAFNQELLVKLVYKDTLPNAKDPFGNTLSCGDTSYREYNPEKAKKLLAQYGKPVELELLHTSTPRGKEAGEIIQRLYKDVGVTVKLVPVTEGQMAKRVLSSDFQFSGWRFMDSGDMGPFLNNILHTGSPMNYMKYSNPKMDELLDRQKTSIDPVVRKKALCEVAKLANEDAVFFYGGGLRFHLIAKTAVQGITGAEHGIVKMSDVWVDGNGKKVAATK